MEDEVQPEELDHQYIIGIDLGTTNSAVVYVDLGAASDDMDTDSRRQMRTFPIPQLVAPGEVSNTPILPSFLYLPGRYDLPPESTALPWAAERRYVVGELALAQGAQIPERLVSSAKSWLSYDGVDRTADILPWAAEDNGYKISPVEASTRYLQHIREAWNHEMATSGVEANGDAIGQGRFEEQLIVLTVPASFDEVARELTLAAAREAGFAKVILLEEPQAAFYSWLSRHEGDWHKRMKQGELILVCDVGGGTTDFTVIAVREGATGLRFDRLAVGDHLMLGGDNMDLTLGRLLEARLTGQAGTLDSRRWPQLVYQCRRAKETLLSSGSTDDTVDITLVGEAGQLIAGTLKAQLTHSEVERVILDGFFPQVQLTDLPGEVSRTGLTELGLPYVQDPAITHHLARFWKRFEPLLRNETGRQEPYPDYLLFNGGTLAPKAIRERLSTTVTDWFNPRVGAEWTPVELENPRPELAVAIGAAYYGLVRLGKGVRVGSGSPRAYYVGVASTEQEATGQHAVCIVPRGTEEGYEVRLSEPSFEALTNQPASFQLFSSSTRLGDQLGDTVILEPNETSGLPPIQTVLRYGRKGTVERLPVQLGVRLTAVGTLEVWCYSQQSDHRWQLQFDIRQMTETAEQPATAQQEAIFAETVDEAMVEAAQKVIRQTFSRENSSSEHDPARLRRSLEELFSLPKEAWPTALIRRLADTLLDTMSDRAITAEHEARWLNLLGFCLRPGFGDPVDEWRMKRVWTLFFQGLQFPRQTQNRTEWWIFWRRVAGGMKAGQQSDFFNHVRGYVLAGGSKRRKKSTNPYPKKLSDAEVSEIWLALANFEWLPANTKTELGRALLQKGKKRHYKLQELWALSRLGARTPAYGPVDRLIPGSEASAWLETILDMPLQHVDGVAQVLVMLARHTGDRVRDVPADNRNRVAAWLDGHPRSDRFQSLLMDGEATLDKEEREMVFGDSLPEGLVLMNTNGGESEARV